MLVRFFEVVVSVLRSLGLILLVFGIWLRGLGKKETCAHASTSTATEKRLINFRIAVYFSFNAGVYGSAWALPMEGGVVLSYTQAMAGTILLQGPSVGQRIEQRVRKYLVRIG